MLRLICFGDAVYTSLFRKSLLITEQNQFKVSVTSDLYNLLQLGAGFKVNSFGHRVLIFFDLVEITWFGHFPFLF